MTTLHHLLARLSGHQPPDALTLLHALDQACEGSVIVDRESRIQHISARYARLLGYGEDDALLGQVVEQVIPNSLMRQVVESGQPQLLDIMRIHGRWTVVTRLPLFDAQGKTAGAIGFVFYQHLDYLKPLVGKFARVQPPRKTPSPNGGARAVRYGFSDFAGHSPVTLGVRQRALRAARLDSSILLLGETGTGKELLAQAIHAASPRAEGPFVGVNTAALPEALVEAELFGASASAYTGADPRGRTGKFQLAQGGTLFLDEIGDMSLPVQAKLLRVLQEREVEPLGSDRVIPVDVRVIAATSRDLQALVESGDFRPDLYYRLNVLPLTLPPLRERLDDLPELCALLTRSIADEMGVPPPALSAELLDHLGHYHWPGNIRELRNVLERACLFAEQGELDLSLLSQFLPKRAGDAAQTSAVIPAPEAAQSAKPQPTPAIRPLSQVLADAEREALLHALHNSASKVKAARALGISRASLYEKLQRHHL